MWVNQQERINFNKDFCFYSQRNELKGSAGLQVGPYSSAKNSSATNGQPVDDESSSSIALRTNSCYALDHVNKKTW